MKGTEEEASQEQLQATNKQENIENKKNDGGSEEEKGKTHQQFFTNTDKFHTLTIFTDTNNYYRPDSF